MKRGNVLLGAIASAVALTGCTSTPDTPTAAPTVTTTALVTAMATTTATVTATATATVTTTATTTAIAQPATPAGPIDVTAEYSAHARDVGMAREQRQELVQVSMDAGVINVLTTMRYPWGSWACEWEPNTLGGESVKFVRILHQDGSLFRICQ